MDEVYYYRRCLKRKNKFVEALENNDYELALKMVTTIGKKKCFFEITFNTLKIIISNNYYEIVNKILKKLKKNMRIIYGCLVNAVCHNNYEMINLILSHCNHTFLNIYRIYYHCNNQSKLKAIIKIHNFRLGINVLQKYLIDDLCFFTLQFL